MRVGSASSLNRCAINSASSSGSGWGRVIGTRARARLDAEGVAGSAPSRRGRHAGVGCVLCTDSSCHARAPSPREASKDPRHDEEPREVVEVGEAVDRRVVVDVPLHRCDERLVQARPAGTLAKIGMTGCSIGINGASCFCMSGFVAAAVNCFETTPSSTKTLL